MLVAFWICQHVLIYRRTPVAGEPSMVRLRPGLRSVVRAAACACRRRGGRHRAVTAFLEIAERFDAPVFLVSFFAASFGSSLPELVVDITASTQRGTRPGRSATYSDRRSSTQRW